jgi:ketosteroid isomerase-like protein
MKHKQLCSFVLTVIGPLLCGATLAQAQTDNDKIGVDIRRILDAQVAAWNRGDVDAFMNGYARSATTVFVSGDTVTRGWQMVRDRYKAKYSDGAKMGALTFSEVEITPVSVDAAVVLGRWELKRENDQPHGRFTLIFRRTPDGWRIVHDHTSSAEK